LYKAGFLNNFIFIEHKNINIVNKATNQISYIYLKSIQLLFMAGTFTFTMIKPAAYENKYAGKILDMILQGGFRIQAIKLVKLSLEQAGEFYGIHKDRPFYNDLVTFMSSGPVLAAILEKENAVDDYRKLIGSTNPADAAEGTIRKLFGTSVQKNAVHGSDSDENAAIEAAFFFSALERF